MNQYMVSVQRGGVFTNIYHGEYSASMRVAGAWIRAGYAVTITKERRVEKHNGT